MKIDVFNLTFENEKLFFDMPLFSYENDWWFWPTNYINHLQWRSLSQF